MRFELNEKEKALIETRKKDPDIMDCCAVKPAGQDMSIGIRITDPVKASYILLRLLNDKKDADCVASRDLGFDITHICQIPVYDYARIEPFKEELIALIDKHFYGEN